LAGDLVAVMFVTTISLLLNTTGVEIATRREADIDKELRALGLASLLSSAFGGYVSSLSLSRTSLAYTAGASGRLAGLTVAGISASMLVFDPRFLSYVLKYALGGLLYLCRRAAVLSMADQISRAATAARLSFAHRDWTDNHWMGLHRRNCDRRRHLLHHVRAERESSKCH